MIDTSSLPDRKTPLPFFPVVWGALKVQGPLPPILIHSPLQFEIEGPGLGLVRSSSAVWWVVLEGRGLASRWEVVSCLAPCLPPPEGVQLLAVLQTWLLLQKNNIHVLYGCMSHI